ncbi:L-lactate permease [Moorena sp. SIO4G3]|uniref:L-lactate permease n=1 Tax=Moorena sp. SIO4G3 TaxID=2607821 RepID=UPI00142B9B0B|nr:L-lactate permease [Moorena sp. SIO4G3]NEO75879.1 L-lactate permease [Moorena sp. SIO4G3]
MEIIIATMPLWVAIVMLVVLQRPSQQAGLATLIAAMGSTLLFPVFRLFPGQLLLALVKGLATSLSVFYVLFPSLLLYYLLKSVDGMSLLGRGIARLVPERDLQVLLLVIGFAPFAESVSGFGVGTILVIPLFLALGYSSAQSAILGILGQMAVPWGGLAIGTVLGAEITNLDPSILGSTTAVLTAPLPVVYGLVALAVSGGKKSVQRRWPEAIAAGVLLTIGVWGFSWIPGVELAGVLGSTLVMSFLVVWANRKLFHKLFHKAKRKRPVNLVNTARNSSEKTAHDSAKYGITKVSLWQVIAPYGILTAILLISRLVVPLKIWLKSHFVISIAAINLNLPLLYNPGFYLLLTALATVTILGTVVHKLQVITIQAWQQFIPGAIALACFLAASQVMQASGMIASLGMAAATLGDKYIWVAPWLAALGGWITGSSTASNALLSQLQQEVSIQSGLPLEWLMGAQNGASAHATMISPARAIIAATAVGWSGAEVFLLRQMGLVVLGAVAVIMSLLVLAVP